jgi:hypothetical protein
VLDNMKAYEAAATCDEDWAKRLRGSHDENTVTVRGRLNISLDRGLHQATVVVLRKFWRSESTSSA